MSNHLSGPNLGFPSGDARLDLADVFAFGSPSGPGRTVLIMDVNPFATGREFHPDAVYRLNIDTDGDAAADVALSVVFSAPQDGRQAAAVYRATGSQAKEAEAADERIIADAATAVDVVRAGHLPPLLLRRASGHVEALEPPGMLLGISPDPLPRTRHLLLDPGDSLIMVTDGITEARSAVGELFGEQRLHDCLAAAVAQHVGARPVLDAVVRAVSNHAAGDTRTMQDDRAALVLTAT